MTLHRLEIYRAQKRQIRAIYNEIEDLYRYVKTSSFERPNKTTDGRSITERIVERINSKEETLGRLLEKTREVEAYIDAIEEPEIAAICIYHFKIGKSWQETAELCGYERTSPRKKIIRYLEREEDGNI